MSPTAWAVVIIGILGIFIPLGSSHHARDVDSQSGMFALDSIQSTRLLKKRYSHQSQTHVNGDLTNEQGVSTPRDDPGTSNSPLKNLHDDPSSEILGLQNNHLAPQVLEKTLEKRQSNRTITVEIGNNSGNNNIDQKSGINGEDFNDPQVAPRLSPDAVQSASKVDGKEAANQAPSLTSENNFINFCISTAGKVQGAVLMNGLQTKKQAACNPIPMGMVPSQDKIPAVKFISPKNLDKIQSKKAFKVTLSVKNLVVGQFTNPGTTFFSAPVQLDPSIGAVLGHTHIVIQLIDSLTSTAIVDPKKFAFFKGVDNAADQDGNVSVDVPDGLPAGAYRISTINTAANHQPILLSCAAHDTIEDMIYVTAT